MIHQPVMQRLARHLTLAAMLLFLAGCASMPAPNTSKPPVSQAPRNIAIFFDGTYNHAGSGTNVAVLHDWLRGQSHDIGLFYIEGVGAHGKIIGMAMAWGIGYRVRQAYTYLLENYRDGDNIYLFGFSRGAYSARILAAMLYHAGLPLHAISPAQAQDLSETIYTAFKGDMSSADRIASTASAASRAGGGTMRAVPVRFMGLWDTVEALGWPDYEENVDVPNPRYGDQLCNVQQAAHAVSLDDNRARIFTPILLTRHHLLRDCGRGGVPDDAAQRADIINGKVNEVYFAGAHADVGGGYDDGVGKLSGVSLNWMLGQALKAGLLPDHADNAAITPPTFPADPLAPSHDPEGDLPYSMFYKRMYRAIDTYADSAESTTRRIRFHHALKQRIETLPRGASEYAGSDPKAREAMPASGTGRFDTCFPQQGDVRRYREEACQATLQVVND